MGPEDVLAASQQKFDLVTRWFVSRESRNGLTQLVAHEVSSGNPDQVELGSKATVAAQIKSVVASSKTRQSIGAGRLGGVRGAGDKAETPCGPIGTEADDGQVATQNAFSEAAPLPASIQIAEGLCELLPAIIVHLVAHPGSRQVQESCFLHAASVVELGTDNPASVGCSGGSVVCPECQVQHGPPFTCVVRVAWIIVKRHGSHLT